MARGRLFYGWWVTIAFAVMVFLSSDVHFSVGPFLKPIIADLGTDRAASAFGTIFVVNQGGAVLGSCLGGLLFELTGGYGAAFAIACVQLLVAAVVSLTIDEAARCVPRLRPAAAEQ
jgi:predicted MFS family arabinose efflux permease